jgi:hypothetical protein
MLRTAEWRQYTAGLLAAEPISSRSAAVTTSPRAPPLAFCERWALAQALVLLVVDLREVGNLNGVRPTVSPATPVGDHHIHRRRWIAAQRVQYEFPNGAVVSMR